MARACTGVALLAVLACVTAACAGPSAVAHSDAHDAFASDAGSDAPSGSADTTDTSADSSGEAEVDAGSAMAPARAAALADFVTAQLAKAHVPGLAAGIVKGGKLAWTGAYGWADVDQKVPARPETVFMIASVSKTVTAAGIMAAVEQGHVTLDADVQTWLPFPLRSAHAPTVPITLRLLLTHTSGIADNWDVMDTTYVLGDSPVPLGTFLQQYLTPDGKYWDAGQNWGKQKPGTKYDYSDIGVSVAAYAVELATKVSFDTWCATQVFAPLGMTETSFRLAGLDPSHVALPYGWKAAEGYVSYGLYGYPDYPDGGLRTSVPQLAKFLPMFMQDGEYAGKQLLKAQTVAEMKKVQFPEVDDAQALVWYFEDRDGQTYMGHNGGDRGIYTEMFFRPGDGVGVILLSNGDVETDAATAALTAIEQRLFEEGDAILP